MLLVPTYVGPSKIHGMGLFAAFPIPKGIGVWHYSPGLDRCYTNDMLPMMETLQKVFIFTYGYFDKNQNMWILCMDNVRFMNHSSTPNIKVLPHMSVAARDIAQDEELTEDYRTFDHREASFV